MFFSFIVQPLSNALVFFYNTVAVQDLGIAIVLLTLAIRILFFPFFHKGARYQAIMQKIQPRIKEIQERHKDDKAVQVQKTMELYKTHNINPFWSIMFLVVQIPVLLGLYRIFLKDFSAENFAPLLYSFVDLPSSFRPFLLGLINLHEPSILMVCLAAIAQYAHGRLTLRKSASGKSVTQAEKFARNMVVMGPILTVLIFFRLPAAIGLYWLVTSIFSIGQQIVVNKHISHNDQSVSVETISRRPSL